MQSFVFKRSFKANRFLSITKGLTNNKNNHLQIRPLTLKLIDSLERQKIIPVLSTQLKVKYNQLILIFNKLQSILNEKLNHFDLFSKSSFKRDQNNNNSKQKNTETPPPPQNPIVNLLITIASLYIAYNLLKDIERMRGQNKNTNGQMQGVVLDDASKTNVNDGATKINISQKNGNTFGVVITWNELVTQLLANKLVSKVHLSTSVSSIAIIYLKKPVVINGYRNDFFVYNLSPNENLEAKLAKAQDDLNYKDDERVEIFFSDPTLINNIIRLLTFTVFAIILFKAGSLLVNKLTSMQMEMFSGMTKANFRVVDPHLKTGVPKVTFKDVAGLHEAKIEVKEFVDYLSKPEKYLKLGARVPKGALLLGPPGCGKTLLAKAVAAEANVPFFNMNGTEFIEMIGGVGASRVRSLFEEAKKQSPSIIYIDEIDAIGKQRSGNDQASGGSGEGDQTLNQLLVSMDGLESNSNVIVLASTNRADTLDKALLRPGRLDRHITIDLPTFLERKEILAVHMRDLITDFDKKNDDFVSQICHLTPRFSGADLANVCNEAALRAAREAHTSITKKDFISALDRVLAGPEKKSSTISIEDQKLIAYRECGSIIVSWFHQYSDLVLKVSLLSRTKANSFSQYLPQDKKLYSKEELFDQMCLYFGGRVAESLVFNRITTQSEQDLKKITNLAYAQVESFGMNDVIGNMSFPTQREEKQSGGGVGKRPYSKKLRNIIDQEVNKLIAQAHSSAEKTVRNNIEKLHKLSEELMKKESLNYEEIVKLIGPPLNKSRYTLAELNLKTSSDI